MGHCLERTAMGLGGGISGSKRHADPPGVRGTFQLGVPIIPRGICFGLAHGTFIGLGGGNIAGVFSPPSRRRLCTLCRGGKPVAPSSWELGAAAALVSGTGTAGGASLEPPASRRGAFLEGSVASPTSAVPALMATAGSRWTAEASGGAVLARPLRQALAMSRRSRRSRRPRPNPACTCLRFPPTTSMKQASLAPGGIGEADELEPSAPVPPACATRGGTTAPCPRHRCTVVVLTGPPRTNPWGLSSIGRGGSVYLRLAALLNAPVKPSPAELPQLFAFAALSRAPLRSSTPRQYSSSSAGSKIRTCGLRNPNIRLVRLMSCNNTKQSSGRCSLKCAKLSPSRWSQYSTDTACSANCRIDTCVCGCEKPDTRSKQPRWHRLLSETASVGTGMSTPSRLNVPLLVSTDKPSPTEGRGASPLRGRGAQMPLGSGTPPPEGSPQSPCRVAPLVSCGRPPPQSCGTPVPFSLEVRTAPPTAGDVTAAALPKVRAERFRA
mmetsp:Transcript_61041/g.170782  ORF Transcript_61041/g.170782 Transcript_61041/m.170782 type:complete len:495 (-) Transcript_61041:65-1549(-)